MVTSPYHIYLMDKWILGEESIIRKFWPNVLQELSHR